MIIFYGYNDGQAVAIQNRRVLLRLALCSLVLVIPLTVLAIVIKEYSCLIVWCIPFLFLLFFALTFPMAKYDDRIFLKGLKTKHLFQLSNAKLYKDGKEVKQVEKIKLYRRKKYLFLVTGRSYFRIPNDAYTVGSREELLQRVSLCKNHTIRLLLPPVTEEEKKEILLRKINLEGKCRLFYSKDRDRIVYIYQREDGFFSIGAERLELADDEDAQMMNVYGWWEQENIGKSIFQTEEMAFREIKNTIDEYEELKRN